MKVQLLLLSALVGLLCGFTCASPTSVPTESYTVAIQTVTETSSVFETVTVDLVTVVTGPPPTKPPAVPEEIVTQVFTDAGTTSIAVPTTELVVEKSTVVRTEVEREATDPPNTPTPYPGLNHVETLFPTEQVLDDTQREDPAETQTPKQQVIFEDDKDGLNSGHIVGIVIGALLAVVIVVAVVIAVLRRMGKYSSTKNKKPGKKERVMVSALRKKQTKQQDHAKFWKF